MSCTVYAGEDYSIAGCVRFHNGFAWFLDSIFGGKELPHSFFSQAVGPGQHPDPGPLSPEGAIEFAEAVDALTDEGLDKRMWDAMNGREDDGVGMGPAIQTVREIAVIAHRGEGLAVT